MSKTGRNDPCPCGSGKKYKNCCIHEEVEPATDIGTVDGVVTKKLVEWVLREHSERARALVPLVSEELWNSEGAQAHAHMLIAYEMTAGDGTRLCLQFPEAMRRAFSPREQRWLEEQRQSWFAIWDVLEVRQDEGMFLRDVFTGEERFVREARATHYLHDRELLLARIVRLDATWALAATHPQLLPPHAGDAVQAEARRILKLGRGKVDPDRLRGEAAFRLTALWDEAVRGLLQAPRPHLQNTEGDPLVLTEDAYAFDPADRDAVLKQLREFPDGEEDDSEPEATTRRFGFCTPGEEGLTRIAGVVVHERTLAVDANSTRRADEMRARLEESLGERVRFVERTETDPWEIIDTGESEEEEEEPAAPEIPAEEAAKLILGFKEKHYATWPDTPLPALGGVTPREAARDKRRKVYRELDLVLRDIERGEAREPFEQRYDVQALRRELGL